MNFEHFLQKSRANWQALEALLDKAQEFSSKKRLSAKGSTRNSLEHQPKQGKRSTKLSTDELDSLGRLYRIATSDLALARREFPGHQVTAYLNQLVGRSHGQIYQGKPLQRNQLAHFFGVTFPQLYRAILPYTTTAFILFMIPSLVAFITVWRSPDTIYLFEGERIRPLVQQVEQGELWVDMAPQIRSTMSAMIMTNNIRVTFLAFAGGILAGLLSVYVMIFNGIHLGAIFGLLQFHGLSGGLAEFVVGHGFIELSVIMLAGGCGLYLGDGLLRPGLLSRKQALVERGRISVQLILGCVPLLILAGLIEGFISPSEGLPWQIKLAVGAVTGLLLHLYWLRGGQTKTA